MAVGDAVGRREGRRAAAWLLVLAVTGGCSFGAAHDDDGPAASAASLEVPPPPASVAPAGSVTARAAQTATRIETVTIESAPPTTRVVLQLDGTAEPEVSLLVNQRLVIDVPDTTCATVPRVIEAPGDPLVERVRTGQHAPPESKSRVVVDLRRRADFSVRAQGDRIVAFLTPAGGASEPGDGSRILFGAESVPGEAAATVPPEPAMTPDLVLPPEPAPPPTSEPPPASAPSPEPLGHEAMPVTAAPEPVPSPVAAVPEGTPEPVAVVPEGTQEPVAVVPQGTQEPVAVVPEPAPTPGVAEPEPVLAAPDASASTPEPYLVEATPTASPQPEPTRAGGKRISIDFTEADVRTVIELIASAGGYKVLFTPEVGGTVTISVVDRPWEDALATVLRARRLREVRHEDVMLVSPAGR